VRVDFRTRTAAVARPVSHACGPEPPRFLGGIVFPPTGPFWISDNYAGVSTLYKGNGNPFPVASPLVVNDSAADWR